MKVIILKGLPGCGKSTWAKEQIDANPNNIKRVNKDLLREMLDCGNYTGKSEKFILDIRDQIILKSLDEGKNVIVDDTNLNPTHEARIKQLVKDKADIEIKEFDIPIEECIKRDLKRANPVGKDVIMDMYKKWKKTPFKQKEINPELTYCLIVDIDGTIAEMNHRGPYDWDKVGTDNPVLEIIDLAKSLYSFENIDLVFLSGRDGCCYAETESWLKKYFPLESFSLYMRSPGDMRKDSIVKQELYNEHIKDKYNVFLVIDDRQQVVDMWRSLGLRCIQVAEGDF